MIALSFYPIIISLAYVLIHIVTKPILKLTSRAEAREPIAFYLYLLDPPLMPKLRLLAICIETRDSFWPKAASNLYRDNRQYLTYFYCSYLAPKLERYCIHAVECHGTHH